MLQKMNEPFLLDERGVFKYPAVTEDLRQQVFKFIDAVDAKVAIGVGEETGLDIGLRMRKKKDGSTGVHDLQLPFHPRLLR
jgi:hypothetical protein